MHPLILASRQISPQHPVLVIAEIGVNHDGSADRAVELVDHAARAGADAVKLQIFRATSLIHPTGKFAEYQQRQCDDADPGAMLKRYELAPAAIRQVVAAIRDRGLIPLATPFSPTDVDVIGRLELPAIKIASPDLINWPLLKKTSLLNKPFLISTGAATLEEITTTTSWLRDWGVKYALLHCVSSYPTPVDQSHLRWITELASQFDVPIGYSDHSTEEFAGALAVGAGACIVEKHLTYDRLAPGPDHAASADPEQFARYVQNIRLAEKMLGQPGKRVLPIEEDVRRVSRQSLVTTRDLPAGHVLNESDLTVQRPGTGLSASLLPTTVGKKLRHALPAGTILRQEFLH